MAHTKNTIAAAIEELVRSARDDDQPGKYRTLVQFGIEHDIEPPRFARYLIEAGMKSPNANALKKILSAPLVAAAYVAEEYTYAAAVRLARQKGGPVTPTNRAGAKSAVCTVSSEEVEITKAVERLLKAIDKAQAQIPGDNIRTDTEDPMSRPWAITCGVYQIQFAPRGAK